MVKFYLTINKYSEKQQAKHNFKSTAGVGCRWYTACQAGVTIFPLLSCWRTFAAWTTLANLTGPTSYKSRFWTTNSAARKCWLNNNLRWFITLWNYVQMMKIQSELTYPSVVIWGSPPLWFTKVTCNHLGLTISWKENSFVCLFRQHSKLKMWSIEVNLNLKHHYKTSSV